jgi:3-hydroxyacyl-[acyl-carrier-protein] dehydratase
MLLKEFYTVEMLKQIGPDEISATIKLNPAHEIYKGHFPGQPVVPGVVSIQIINELLSGHINQSLITLSARNIKFPSMIDPRKTPILDIKINYKPSDSSQIKVNASIFKDDMIFLKFNGSMKVS